MLIEFITPLKEETLDIDSLVSDHQMGRKIHINTSNEFDLSEYEIAIVSIDEDRASVHNPGCGSGAEAIRKAFYRLYAHFKVPATIDLGHIPKGESVKDSHAALTAVLKQLRTEGLTVIVLGSGQDVSYAQYRAYEEDVQHTDVVIVDEKIDLTESETIDSSSYLWHILTHEPNYLFNITHLASQQFYSDPKMIDMLDSLHYDVCRLGEIKQNIFEVEPLIRHADMVSFDLSAIKSCDCPANAHTSPNGLTGEEACQLSRFSGFSQKTSTFGIYEYNTFFDQNHQGAKQVSQMMWYFIEGYSNRRVDHPAEEDNNYTKYMVELESTDQQIIFWKSKITDRWWMEIPHRDKKETMILPCSYADYERALTDELPDRWMSVYKRIH